VRKQGDQNMNNNKLFLRAFATLQKQEPSKACRVFDELLHLYNAFAIDTRNETILLNNDDAFMDLTAGLDALDIRNRLYFGKYDMADAFIMFNGYGNIETLHYTEQLYNYIDNDFIVWADENEIDLFQVSGIIE
jgi:hypothetical protein